MYISIVWILKLPHTRAMPDDRQMSVSLPNNGFIASPRRVSPSPHAISKHVEQELQNLQDSSHCHRG